jgi:hypothetical protein
MKVKNKRKGEDVKTKLSFVISVPVSFRKPTSHNIFLYSDLEMTNYIWCELRT